MEQLTVLTEKGFAITEGCSQLSTSYIYCLASLVIIVIYEAETDELLKIIR